jgi:phage shock protein E
MRVALQLCAVALAACAASPAAALEPPFANPAIDMPAFLATAGQAAGHRETRRVSEDEFLRLRAQRGTVVLDARSAAHFARMHVRGAINLPFPEIAIERLQALVPDRGTTILIYCNNNFVNAELEFPAKLPTASLNLSTYVALYTYGYRNVYELGPSVDVRETRLPMDSVRD